MSHFSKNLGVFLITEVFTSSRATSPSSLTDPSGEIVKAVKHLHPSAKSSSIRRILTRLSQNSQYNVSRTETRPYLYYVTTIKEKELDYEFQEFWDPNLPLWIHRIMIMIENVPVKKSEKFEVRFFDYPETIKFSFNANTKKIRIDFKCSDWRKALDCYDFDAFCQTIETVLEVKSLPGYFEQALLVNVDFNQDIENVRIAGANYISVQAFRNSLLVCYNKGTGHRREQQFNELNIPFDRVRKQLSRKSTELKIGTVFDKTNLLLNEIQINQNKITNRFNHFYDYGQKLLQEHDVQLYAVNQAASTLLQIASNIENNQISLATIQQQTASSINNLVTNQLVQNEMLRDHDENIERQINNIQNDIEIIKQETRKNIVRSDSIQDKILQELEQADKSAYELADALNLEYGIIFYHLKKLEKKKKILSLKDENQRGRGRKKLIYQILR